MDEKNNSKNIYLIEKIARKASCRRAILSYSNFGVKNFSVKNADVKKPLRKSFENIESCKISARLEFICV